MTNSDTSTNTTVLAVACRDEPTLTYPFPYKFHNDKLISISNDMCILHLKQKYKEDTFEEKQTNTKFENYLFIQKVAKVVSTLDLSQRNTIPVYDEVHVPVKSLLNIEDSMNEEIVDLIINW